MRTQMARSHPTLATLMNRHCTRQNSLSMIRTAPSDSLRKWSQSQTRCSFPIAALCLLVATRRGSMSWKWWSQDPSTRPTKTAASSLMCSFQPTIPTRRPRSTCEPQAIKRSDSIPICTTTAKSVWAYWTHGRVDQKKHGTVKHLVSSKQAN